MKRFITYLYTYKDSQKVKNTGYIRVDIRSQILNMQINMKDAELDNEKGVFYIILKNESIRRIPLMDIWVRGGQFCGKVSYGPNREEGYRTGFEAIIGVCIEYENSMYMASCWKDGEEEVIANGEFLLHDTKEDTKDMKIEEVCSKQEENIDVASLQKENMKDALLQEENMEAVSLQEENMKVASLQKEKAYQEVESCYQKINLNEIYALPSRAWHFSNNSFLLHGFWNYGYLVLKETVEENQKRIALGVPGIFEEPEKIMATYFGFPEFEALPLQVLEMEIGPHETCVLEVKNQHPKAGTLGCWFANL